jgi:hypothetical protein
MTDLNRSLHPNLGLAALKRELAQAAQGNRAGYLAWFKTGKGEYAEGDKFIGVRVPARNAPSPGNIAIWNWARSRSCWNPASTNIDLPAC